MSEKFDFTKLNLSKQPDQEKFSEEFEKLPENEKSELTDEAHIEAWKYEIYRMTRDKDIDSAEKAKLEYKMLKKANFPEEEIRDRISKLIFCKISDINDGDKYDRLAVAIEMAESFDFTGDIMKTPEAYNAALEYVEGYVYKVGESVNDKNNREENFLKIKSFFNIPDDAIKEIASKVIMSALKGRTDGARLAVKIFEKFDVPEAELRTLENQDIVREGILMQIVFAVSNSYSGGCGLIDFIKIKEKFGLEPLLEIFDPEKIDANFKRYNQKGKYSEEMFNSEAINEIFDIIRHLTYGLENKNTLEDNEGQLRDIEKIKEEFHITEEEKMASVKGGLAFNIREGQRRAVLFILKSYKLSDGEAQSLVDQEFKECMQDGSFEKVIKIKEVFSKDFPINMSEQEIQTLLELSYPMGVTFDELSEICKSKPLGDKLTKSLYKLDKFSFVDHIKPLLMAQGDSAYLYFEAIKKMWNFKRLLPEDIEYIVYVGKKYSTQARNILENLLNGISSIGSERDILEDYIGEIGIAHPRIYSAYKRAKESGKQEEVEMLINRVKGLQRKIYKGDMAESDYNDSFYKAVSYYSFPPAIGLTQDQYDSLNNSRPDRRQDVPDALNLLQYEKFQVTTGRYVLEQGAELNLNEWAALSRAVEKVNTEIETGNELSIDTAEIGGKLIEIYSLKKQNTDEGKGELFESMYRYHLSHGGGKLESGYEISIDGLMKYKEFIGDRIKNDLVKECIAGWRSEHSSEYKELKKETLNRMKQSENQNFSKVKNIIEGIRKQRNEEKKQNAINILDSFLSNFGLSYESVKEMDSDRLQAELGAISFEYNGEIAKSEHRTEEYYNSESFISAYDQLLARYDQDALVIQKISSDLVAGINKKMRKELDKFEFSAGGGKVEELDLEFVISKKKEHGVAGYNMGVCVTPDAKLWNDPQFMNCIIFEPQTKQAMGGMHLLIRENCLCLPGINPSMDVLSQVENDKLFSRMIEYAKKVQESLGLDKVLIPTASSIHSNRQPVQEIIRKKNYKKFNLSKKADFSYHPYGYSFQECFEVN